MGDYMKISYYKNKNNSMHFIDIDGIRILNNICQYLGMSLEEYINTIKLCGGKYSPKHGWFLPNEDAAIECVVLLNLLKK